MKTGTRNIIVAGAVILAVTSLVAALYYKPQNRVVYIDNVRLFNEFLLKKELENDLVKRETRWKAQLDSMRIQLNLLGKRIESEKVSRETAEKFEIDRQHYLEKEEQYRNDNEKTAKQFNEQIWKQLNNYVKDFAKENEYDFVLGTSGEGNLMFANEKHDATAAAIIFVNQKYKGKNG